MTTATRFTYKAGDIHRFNLQEDVFFGTYVLVEKAPDRNRPGYEAWVVEHQAPDATTIEAILEYAISVADADYEAWCFERDAVTGERTYEAEIAHREARAGDRSVYSFPKTAKAAARWHDAF